MEYSQALQKLRNHANAPGTGLPEDESLLLALWQAERQASIPKLQIFLDDILGCLEAVNHKFNTQHPSGSVTGKLEALPRSVVGDISAIISGGWNFYWRWSLSQQFNEAFRLECATCLVKLGIAWNFVLDGDIDDIRKDVETEFRARFSLSAKVNVSNENR